MKKKSITLIFIILFIVLGLGLAFLYSYANRLKYNSTYVNGNTAGNLYNGGFFCENNGTIYFSNPDDENRLYAMDSNGKNLRKLCNDTATFINADDNYVYYVRNNPRADLSFTYFSFHQNSLCRISKDGTSAQVLDQDPCNYATLCGNYIYYLHYDDEEASTLYKVKIDGTERQQVLNYAVYTCSTNGQYIYYNGMKTNGSIYRLDTVTDQEILLYECSSYKPIISNGMDVYYLDVEQNNALVRTNMNWDTPTLLSSDSIDVYNVYGDTIYYQNFKENKESAFCSIKTDGTENNIITQGSYTNIHVTSNFVFFTDYYSGEVYYFSRNNPDNILKFHPGTK